MTGSITKIKDILPFTGDFSFVEISSDLDRAADLLGNEEKQEFDNCTSLKRKQEFLSSRITLKRMAGQLGADSSFEVLKDELGQPYGKTKFKTYYVSIAHTDKHVFCGLTESNAIGIDLEPVEREVPLKLKHRITHPKETVLADTISTIRLWTIKEAYIKLRGKGLRLNMDEVQISQENDRIFTEINDDKRAKICSFQFQNNWLSIAFYN